MEREEWLFAVTMSAVHGLDHLLKRLFPPLVPVWAAAFGFPLWKLGAVLGAHTLGSAIGQAPLGHLADRHDRRRLLAGGVALVGLGTVAVGAVSGTAWGGVTVAGQAFGGRFLLLLAAMVAAGLGSSAVHPTGYPLISANVDGDRRGKVLGMWGSASKFGDGLAPLFVGVLLIVVAWHWILVGFGLLTLAAALALLLVLREFDTRPADPDAADTATEAVTGDRRRFIYPFAAVAVYFAVQIAAANAVTVFLPQFLTATYDLAVSVAGVSLTAESTASFYYAALLIVAGVVQLGTGELTDRHDPRLLLVAFLVVAAAAVATLALLAPTPPFLLAVLVVLGAGLWGLNPARDQLVSEIAPAGGEGKTFGYLWTGALLVSAASPPAVGYVGDVAGLRTGFALVAALILLSGVPVALLLSDRVYVAEEGIEAAPGD
ncbi:MAG: MFS transporter [Haloferacaceae archaeon]